MPIRVLAEPVVQMIAAGEVIERPASVVKELVENSLDAAARRIRVRVSGAGLSEISVSDDGSGIPREEVELAFARHATSKLSSVEDLARLRTLGFRGEALASIAAVSDVTLSTTHEQEESGSRLRVAFGEKLDSGPCAVARGTTVTVQDLFANVPARRRFLRKPATEVQHMIGVISRYAVAHPEVAFSLSLDGREVLRTFGGGLLDAMRRVYGPETGDALLPFDYEDRGIKAFGYASPPDLHRASSRQMDVFVNGRWIQDRMLTRAMMEAYRTLLPTGRYPIACLLLEVPSDRVDVNVHPAKSEVRFAEPDLVFQVALRAIRTANSPASFVPPLPTSHSWEEARASSQEALSRLASGLARAEGPLTEAPTAPGTSGALPPLRAVGQIRQTYIVAEGPDGLYLVDQHAAHERILYEQYLAKLRRGEPVSQGLLTSVPVTVGFQRSGHLSQVLPKLAQMGFELEQFGPDVVLLRAVPSILAERGSAVQEAFLEVFDALAGGDDEERWLEHSLVSLVCHAAIRAGQMLEVADMRQLLRDLEQTGAPRTCPHGRPTMLYLSAHQVEREFRRR